MLLDVLKDPAWKEVVSAKMVGLSPLYFATFFQSVRILFDGRVTREFLNAYPFNAHALFHMPSSAGRPVLQAHSDGRV